MRGRYSRQTCLTLRSGSDLMKTYVFNALLAASIWQISAAAYAVQSPYTASTSTAGDKGRKMDELKPFAAGGAKIVESISGDLKGDGSVGVVLVLDPPSTAAPASGEGPDRLVKILVRDEVGKLKDAASNARMVPCATCGGIAGDPYGYTRVERGSFTVAIGGGSRERWSDEFTFTYAAARKNWFVTHVVRNVEDQDTGKRKTVELDRAALGDVSFGDFDPARLPEAVLP